MTAKEREQIRIKVIRKKENLEKTLNLLRNIEQDNSIEQCYKDKVYEMALKGEPYRKIYQYAVASFTWQLLQRQQIDIQNIDEN